MDTNQITNASPELTQQHCRRVMVCILVGSIFALAGIVFLLAWPDAQERKLVGIWRSYVEGAEEYDFIQLESSQPLTRFEADTARFTTRVCIGMSRTATFVLMSRAHVQASFGFSKNLWYTGTSAVTRPALTEFQIKWHDENTCTFIKADDDALIRVAT